MSLIANMTINLEDEVIDLMSDSEHEGPKTITILDSDEEVSARKEAKKKQRSEARKARLERESKQRAESEAARRAKAAATQAKRKATIKKRKEDAIHGHALNAAWDRQERVGIERQRQREAKNAHDLATYGQVYYH